MSLYPTRAGARVVALDLTLADVAALPLSEAMRLEDELGVRLSWRGGRVRLVGAKQPRSVS